MNAESLLLLQALEDVVDQAFADVQPCSFAAGDCLIQEGGPVEGLLRLADAAGFAPGETHCRLEQAQVNLFSVSSR